MQQQQASPAIHTNEVDQFFLLNTTLIASHVKHFQKQANTSKQLIIQTSNLPLLPEFLISHCNQLSGVFSTCHDLSCLFLKSLFGVTTKLNERISLVKQYESACRQTQKALVALQKTKQKTAIDNQKVDLQLTDLQFHKSVEQRTKDELDLLSGTIKREIRGWKSEYDQEVDQMLRTLASKQLSSHKLFINRLEEAINASEKY